MANYPLKIVYLDYDRILVTKEFIERNNLTLGRSQQEIVSQIKEESSNFFSFVPDVLCDYLTLNEAEGVFSAEYLSEVAEGKTEHVVITDINEAVQDFLDYMVFAWGKAKDQRGLSAGRSISKLGAWLWLFGREDLETLLNDNGLYNPYGAPALIAVCENLGIEVPEDVVEFAKDKC